MSNSRHLFNVYVQTIRAFGSHPAISFREGPSYKHLTFNELNQNVLQLGNLLKAVGVGVQDKVVLILGNQPEYPISFFAVMSVEATAVPLDNQLSGEQVQNIITHCSAKVLIVTQSIYAKIQKDIANVYVIVIDSESVQNQLKSAVSEAQFVNNSSEDSVAVIFYTSGTTEMPKGVMLSHRNLISNVESILKLKITRPRDGIISILPLHHAYSFTVTLLIPLFSGSKIVYPPSLTSVDLLACLCVEKVAIFVGVPQVFSMIHRSIDGKIKKLSTLKRIIVEVLGNLFYVLRKTLGINLSKKLFKEIHKTFGGELRFMVSGGARLDPKVAKDFSKWGFTILEGYGLTETSPIVSFNVSANPKIGSVGKPIANVEIKIINPDDKGIGEVVVRGPNVMLGYYAMPEQTKNVIKDGWFYTGDLGKIDRKGYLRLVGRKKEIIVLSNGKNINPEVVEKHYAQNSYIKEIAVLPTLSQGQLKGIEQLKAVVVLDEEQLKGGDEADIREQLRLQLEALSAKLKSYERINGYVISKESLPRTRLGKIKRYQLPGIYSHLSEPLAGTLEAAPQVSPKSNSEFALREFEQILGKKVNLKDHLELDLGLDSLSRMELLMNLQERLHLQLSDEENLQFFLCQTVEELMNKLEAYLPTDKRVG